MARRLAPDTSPELRGQVYGYISKVLPIIELPIITATVWLSPHPWLSLASGIFFPVCGVTLMKLSSHGALRLEKPLMVANGLNLGLFCLASGPLAPSWLEGLLYLTVLMYLISEPAWRIGFAAGAIGVAVTGLFFAGRELHWLFGIGLALFTFALLMFRTLRVVIDQNNEIDRLLHNVFPSSIAVELKKQMTVQPMLHESVSVLFTDFVGFTESAAKMSPAMLVSELDSLFSRFDSISEGHNLEKLKTIGDSYMAAGGIPAANPTHAIDCVLAALEMRALITRVAEEHRAAGLPGWQLRIGVHTGSLVAGVIGSKRFAYDIWGDTVNMASRMESSSAPNQINVSRDTYERVRDWFECEYRGQRPAKGKGEVDMYFVRRLKPELSADEDGTLPNDEFHLRYRALQAARNNSGSHPAVTAAAS